MHHINYTYNPVFTKKKTSKRKKKTTQIPTYKVFSPNEEDQDYYIGSFVLGTTHNTLPDKWDYCNIHIENSTETDFVIIGFSDESTMIVSLLADAPTVIDIASTKLFNIDFVKQDRNIRIHLYFRQLPITYYTKRASNTIKEVFHIIFNIASDVNKFKTNDSVDPLSLLQEMYKKIRASQSELNIAKTDIQSKHLKPILRPYQEDAVRWMISRETVVNSDDIKHPAFIPVELPTGVTIYYNKYLGQIELNQPYIKATKTGGILADEMGLGKTVEIISCILNHQKELNRVAANMEPVIIKQGKKHSRPADDETEIGFVSYKQDAKRLKLPKRKDKSPVKKALEAWYNNMLRSVNETSTKKRNDILCICGSNSKKGLIQCVDCSKKQHAACMGYQKNVGEYLCPQCWRQRPLLESKATLIVCPVTLKDQWTKEICKHVKSGLTVFQYEGSDALPVYPTELTKYDLVITTYNVLQRDLKLVEGGESKSLRRKSKYGVPGSPITLVKWWRLCFDEAQVVESSTTMVHEMSQKLTAYHRWAVTGTPVSNGLSDLYTLVDFLQIEPYNEVDSWNNILYMPCVEGNTEPMVNFLSKIMWRTQKENVIEQIQIPEQTSHVYVNEFTGVERYFYDREHELSCGDFLQKLRKHDLNKTLNSLSKSDLKLLLEPVLCLRKSCAHPNTVKGRYLVTRKQVRSMSELLDALIAKILSECEDHLRSIIACLNGLAGIYIIRNNVPQAIKEYRNALQIVATYTNDKTTKMQLTIDKLQQIHTLYNLAYFLDRFEVIPKTLRDDTLHSDCAQLEREYIAKFNSATVATIQTCCKYSNDVLESESKFTSNQRNWYPAIVEYFADNNEFQDLRTKIGNVLDNYNYDNKKLKQVEETLLYGNEVKILNYVQEWDDVIHSLREDAVEAVNEIYTIEDDNVNVSKEIVESAADCHLRHSKKKTDDDDVCVICLANLKLKKYEKRLFFTSMNLKKEKELNCRPSIEEQVLKVIYNAGKLKSDIDKEVINDGKVAVHLLEAYKKEFKELRKLWTNLDAQTCAFDEIDICKIRLQLKEEPNETLPAVKELKKLSYEITNPTANIHRLSEFELEFQLMNLQNEGRQSSKLLDKCIGTHTYLQTLHKQQGAGEKPDPCPICKSQLDTKWNILSCGHCYCLECIQVLIARRQGTFDCSICRGKQTLNDINYIELNKAPDEDDNKIKGNCSTKMEAVTKHALKLIEEDADVKMLVFSNWLDVLVVLQTIFEQNGINSLILKPQNIEKVLDQFKDPEQNVTALFMPMKLGSKGLNLTEATHVIFVEPVLDPAEELQAVGRVHRIGQTKPTFVHKFLIKDTIDESIHSATSTNATEWDKNKVTLHQIKNLFSIKAVSSSVHELEDEDAIDAENTISEFVNQVALLEGTLAELENTLAGFVDTQDAESDSTSEDSSDSDTEDSSDESEDSVMDAEDEN